MAKCKKCGGNLIIDITTTFKSDPAMYRVICEDCNDITYISCSDYFKYKNLGNLYTAQGELIDRDFDEI